MICADIEDYESPSDNPSESANGHGDMVLTDATISIKQSEYNEMLLRVRQLESKAKQAESALQDAMSDFAKLRLRKYIR